MKILPVVVLTIMVATLIWPVGICATLPIEKQSLERADYFQLKVDPSYNDCRVAQEGETFFILGDACSSIKNITIDGTNLTVTNTGLVSLGPGDFDGLKQLTALKIELNKRLLTIADGTFLHLQNLTHLTISLGSPQVLSANMFLGLVNLRELNLVKNGFQSFYAISVAVRPATLPSLITLDVSQNEFSVIGVGDTMHLNGSSVENLYMTLCTISWIGPEALNNLSNLRNLRIDDNRLTSNVILPLIGSLTKAAPNMTSLNAQSNLITNPYEILSTISPTNIEWVDVSHGGYSAFVAIDYMHDIPFMPQVKYLDLTASLPVFPNSLFVGPETLPNIEFLYLGSSWNFIYPLRISLPTLRVLDLSTNSPNAFGALQQDQFILENCTSLEELDLSHNPAFVLKSNFVKGAPNLRVLRLSNASLEEIEPFALSHLKNLEVLELGFNHFHATTSLNRTSFSGLVNLQSLNLENCGITCIDDEKTFEHLSQLRSLNLRINCLLELHQHLLVPVINLELLDLSYNSFQSWSNRIFEKNLHLKTVELNDNQITTFHPAMVRDLAVPKVTKINRNPFSCDCSGVTLLRELLNSPNNKEMALVNSLKEPNIYCASPASLRYMSLVSYANSSYHTDGCLDGDGVTVLIVGSICTLIVLIMVGTTASYFLRWHIKYWIFLLRQTLACRIIPKRKNQSNEGKYKYDAFVSYSNEDRGFVVRLVSMLESHAPYFRLCVFERDFEVGGVITDNVVNSLAKSKRTILILSDAYAKSTWCQWELQLAQHKRLFFKDDRHEPLVIIKLGEIMDKHLTPTLRYLIKTRIYLQWNSEPIKQKVFWEKLRTALSVSLDDDEDARPNLQKAVLSNKGNIKTKVVEKVEARDTLNKLGQATEVI